MDWNASAKRQKVQFSLDYFPQSNVQNNIPMQIVSSGPENDVQKIKQGYIKMIMGLNILFGLKRHTLSLMMP